jgi:hypothetical protein
LAIAALPFNSFSENAPVTFEPVWFAQKCVAAGNDCDDAHRPCRRDVPLPPNSAAWKDVTEDCLQRLAIASLTAAAGIDAPADFSDWLSVAAGESEEYDDAGVSAIVR